MRILLALVTAGGLAAADFTLTEKSEVTGGTLKQILDMAARLTGHTSSVRTATYQVSGNRMAVETGRTRTIYDVKAETVTFVDLDKKEYSVLSFAQMTEATRKLEAQFAAMRGQKPEQFAGVSWKATVTKATETRKVAGVATRQAIVQVEMEGAEGNAPGVSRVLMEMWTGDVAGGGALHDFERRLSAKSQLRWHWDALIGGQAGPAALKGLELGWKKGLELPGIPLLTVVRLTGAAKTGGVLLEITSEVMSFSAGRINPAVFEVPAGVKKAGQAAAAAPK